MLEHLYDGLRMYQSGIFTGNRELTGLIPAVDLLGVDTDAAALRAGLKRLFD